MTARGVSWSSIAAVVAVLVALTQLPPAAPAAAQSPVGIEISAVDVDEHPNIALEVAVPAAIADGSVGADDVTVLENGVPVPAEVAAVPTEGLEVVLLLDTSGSMNEANAIDAAKFAAAVFLNELPSDASVGVVAFADTPSLVSPLTRNRDALIAAIGELSARGETSLYDGVLFADTLFSGGTSDRQFVLISDGGDTVSNAALVDAVAVTAGVRTSAIELVTSESNRDALEQLTAAGNGRLTSTADPATLAVWYQDIARSLVNRYRVTLTTGAAGPTTYTVVAQTPAGPVEASTTVALPAPPPTSSTTTVAPTTAQAVVVPPSSDPVVPAAAPAIAAPPVDGGDSGTWLLVAGAVCVFLAISGFVLAMVGTPSRRQRRSRLHWGGDRAATSSSSKTGVGDRITALADDVLVRTGKRGGLAYALDVGAVALRPGEFVVLVAAGMVTAAAVLFALIGPVGALLGAVAVPFVSMAVVRTRIDRRRRRFDEQLPDLLQLVVGALRSGFALPQALDVVANQAAEPAGTEFRRVMFESRVGRDLTESLQGVADRMRSTPFEWVVSAIDINREVGGELAAVLETAAKTVRERQQHERQVLTLTAEGRLSAYVVTALPFVVFLAIGLTNPDYFEPLTESPGPALLGFCGVLLLVGWFWMRRLVRTELS